jgi:hypothetical protein
MTDQDTTGTGRIGDASKKLAQVGNAAPAPTGAGAAPFSPPQPAAQPAPQSPAQPSPQPEKGLGTDIAKILEEVKLPERRDSAQSSKPIENKAATFDTALGAQPAAPEIPALSAEPQPQAQKKEPDIVTPVHTLKDDLQHVVQEEHMSVVRAASLEQDRRARMAAELPAQPATPLVSGRAARILIGSFVLVFLGAAAFFGVYTVMQRQATTPVQSALTSSILFAESSVSIPLDSATPPDSMKQKLAAAINGLQGALGSITAIVPTVTTQNADGTSSTAPATTAQFFSAIGAHPPDELVRALDSRFFFGVHIVDTEAPVMVIPVLSYDHAFAGMLQWEGRLDADLAPIYPALPSTATDKNGLPVNRAFTDDVIRNYDVRELKDDAGNVKLYYSFPSQNVLVIAESPYSFAELLSRLQAARHL